MDFEYTLENTNKLNKFIYNRVRNEFPELGYIKLVQLALLSDCNLPFM